MDKEILAVISEMLIKQDESTAENQRNKTLF